MEQPIGVREYNITAGVRHLSIVRLGYFMLVAIGLFSGITFALGGVISLVRGIPDEITSLITSLWFWAIMLVALGGFYSLYHYPSLTFRRRYKFDLIVFAASFCLSSYIMVTMFELAGGLERQLNMARIFHQEVPPEINAAFRLFSATAVRYMFLFFGLIVALLSLLRIVTVTIDPDRRMKVLGIIQSAQSERAAQPKSEFKGRPINTGKALAYLAIALGVYFVPTLLELVLSAALRARPDFS